ncbi:MAG: 4-phosphoerythronate dehydrogenase [Bacteroides sp.]|nr:4-phosphoerythronate dehydrogenase [Bacteroides sp.]
MATPLNIVVDRNIPFIAEAVAGMGNVAFLPGDGITPEIMRDTDILLTRTRTKCDSRLLDGSRCSFIGTATIGTDHINLDYCKSRGITVANAPGCNAPAVAQYVLAAIARSLKPGECFADRTLGIIGVGNVGSILERWARGLGMHVLLNDPPRRETGDDGKEYVGLDKIAAECDVISVHTPMTTVGRYPTYHLIDEDFIAMTQRRPMIVNAARGPVADTSALKRGLSDGRLSAVCIDCWEGEPDIDPELLSVAAVATPHIAGYSWEGKVRGTSMILAALSAHLREVYGMDIAPELLRRGIPEIGKVPEVITADQIKYDIEADTAALKSAKGGQIASTFESLRNNYKFRPEPKS